MRFQQISQPSLRPRLEILEDRTLMSTCRVTRLSDMGAGMGLRGDLRYCINKVNAEPGADIILIHPSGTINLNTALPDLASDIDMQGPGANLLTVRRAQQFAFPGFRIFNALAGTTVQLSGMTISHGFLGPTNNPSYTVGVGILNDGAMTLVGCVVTQNVGLSHVESHGGGIHNRGTMTIIDSSITNNEIDGFIGHGGGISNTGTMSIYNSTVSGNAAGTSSNNNGWGSGIFNGGSLTVLNSTISGNDGPFGDQGEGIHTHGFTVISHSTIAFNGNGGFGSGLQIYFDAQVFIRNTIVANNAERDVLGQLTSSSYNLFSDSSGGSGFAPTDILDVNPLLAALANNGGPTKTHALNPGSPAIDAGDNGDAPEFDQRGQGFPRIVNGTIDIGAFEVQSTGAPSPHGRASVLALATSDALKGRDMTAQGNALGNEAIFASALKGRDHRTAEYGVSIAPLQGLVHRATFQPRALPWADLFRPFGADGELKIFS